MGPAGRYVGGSRVDVSSALASCIRPTPSFAVTLHYRDAAPPDLSSTCCYPLTLQHPTAVFTALYSGFPYYQGKGKES